MITRFAPSPTGRLHLGHGFSALLAHRAAREAGGTFLLRIEDIDPGRSRAEHIQGILEDLAWLGIDWDGPVLRQSERLPLYQAALDRLKAAGLVYPCTCTRADIAASASAPHGPEGPIYPGICRPNRHPDRHPGESRGPGSRPPGAEQPGEPLATTSTLGPGFHRDDVVKPHAWRLEMSKAVQSLCSCGSRSPDPARHLGSCLRRSALRWTDAEAGEIEARPERFGDVVLARKDAPTSYHLAVTVDDAAQGVTHIIRGRDLFAATDVHRLLQALLGLPTPLYRHHALLAGPGGQRLAKRHGAPTLASLREAGADPRALADDLLAGRLPAGYSAATP